MADLSRVRISGPLEPFATGFASALLRQGYTKNSAYSQMRLMAHLSRWLAGERLDTREFQAADVERFLDARRSAGYTTLFTGKGLRPMLAYLRDQGVSFTSAPAVSGGPVEVMVERYRQYLSKERGLASVTVRSYAALVCPFLDSRISSDGLTLDWDSLCAADVAAFVVSHTPNQCRGTAKLTITALRSLLRFLHVDGAIAGNLTAAVPSVAGWRLAGLPKGLEPDEIQTLVSGCDRRSRIGRRAFAVITTLVRLGLRAAELAAIRLEDIDWRAGTIVVRGKGNEVERLPLPADVGEAVVAYLRQGRPASAVDRTVFVRFKAPYCALSAGAVRHIVAAAACRAGLGRIGAHRLRHTAATQTLRAGAPLSEVGQLLRHRCALTTAIYAKVDRTALRAIARPWPGGVA